MTTAEQMIATLPDAAFRSGYYGAKVVSIDWDSRRSLLADFVAVLPVGAEGWTTLKTALIEELDAHGATEAATLEVALALAINTRDPLIDLDADSKEIAWSLQGWLSARAMGQVGAHVLPAHAVAQASIYN